MYVQNRSKQYNLAKEQKSSEDIYIDIKNIFEKDTFDNIKSSRDNSEKIDILIVEDDDFSRRLISKCFDKNHNLIFAKDGKEAIVKYSLNAPHIAFLDFSLPDLNGLEILQEIRNHDPHGYFVMLTANTNMSDVKQCIASGAQGYIAKPFTKGKIIDYLNLYQKSR